MAIKNEVKMLKNYILGKLRESQIFLIERFLFLIFLNVEEGNVR